LSVMVRDWRAATGSSDFLSCVADEVAESIESIL
jgi:hypothetical protein